MKSYKSSIKTGYGSKRLDKLNNHGGHTPKTTRQLSHKIQVLDLKRLDKIDRKPARGFPYLLSR
ncbi:hypothetical protein MTYP_01431 [Methylophilaceae bacterium]|nr:hypothetical protein MTYP_01431 [Methylophilaceae bacterium]